MVLCVFSQAQREHLYWYPEAPPSLHSAQSEKPTMEEERVMVLVLFSSGAFPVVL